MKTTKPYSLQYDWNCQTLPHTVVLKLFAIWEAFESIENHRKTFDFSVVFLYYGVWIIIYTNKMC